MPWNCSKIALRMIWSCSENDPCRLDPWKLLAQRKMPTELMTSLNRSETARPVEYHSPMMKLLCNCSETAPSLECHSPTLNLLQNCSKTALKFLWNCSETARSLECHLLTTNLLWNCSKTAGKLLWNCSLSGIPFTDHESTLKLLRNRPAHQFPITLPANTNDKNHRINRQTISIPTIRSIQLIHPADPSSRSIFSKKKDNKSENNSQWKGFNLKRIISSPSGI